MKKFNADFLFPLLVLVVLVFALSQQMFNAPPIGKLLDPFIGIVQNESSPGFDDQHFTLDGLGLSDSVKVYFDQRLVPHIYASGPADLYFTQGYVTAGLRLWQMDFISYAAAGRLSEIFSEGFIQYDRNQRRIGMLSAAKASLRVIETNPETKAALNAYTSGVNAYIRRLSAASMPLEYKLLDYQPEPWSNLKTVLLMKHMAQILSGYEEDELMTNLMMALGEDTFNQLFPAFPERMAPIATDSAYHHSITSSRITKPAYLDYSFLSRSTTVPANAYDPTLGSNSWAVSGKKTTTGFPILCNDPHLNFALPAIWLEMQLSAPGLNVYGVSIPGVPAIIIGFNEHIAWGITNGTDDVKDWYKLKLTADYKQYELDGNWRPLKYEVEEIRRRGHRTFYDTIYQTAHGPVVYDSGFDSIHHGLRDHAMRWEMHRPSNEFLTFLHLNRAKDYQGYKAAISHYEAPVQNFTFACKDNTIAVDHQGRLPLKKNGQGKFILDGTRSDQLYERYIAVDSLPHLYNPVTDYVLSANQHPAGAGYPYYLNGYYPEQRALRIQQLLEKDVRFDVPVMKAMQLDNTSNFAAESLPVLLAATDISLLPSAARDALQRLSAWKGTYSAGEQAPVLFSLWWQYIEKFTWDELDNPVFGKKLPDDEVLLRMVRDMPQDPYFDRQGTNIREQAADILLLAFKAAVETMQQKGEPVWGKYNQVNLPHPTRVNAFGKYKLVTDGFAGSINAMSPAAGPSWRMIVALGDTPVAYGIYPGGQSGNPASKHYDDFIDDWREGRYYRLSFFMSAAAAEKAAGHTWTLK